MSSNRRRRLHILCEDRLHVNFVEHLVERWGIGPRQRRIAASPRAQHSAADFVLAQFVDAVRLWRAESHDAGVGLLVVIDGDKLGIERRRRQLLQRLQDAGLPPIASSDPVAIMVPTWHIETWIAWLCGHRPIDEQTRYKAVDEVGRDVGRRIETGEYSVRRAIAAWLPPAVNEAAYVPALTAARRELVRLGVSA